MKFLILAVFGLALAAPTFADDTAAADAASEGEKAAVTTTKTADNTVAEKNARKEVKKVVKEKKAAKKAAAAPAPANARPDGLVIEDVKVGTGPEAKLGSKITVHYKGTLVKGGKEFDSSYGGEPITFDLLEGRLIKGWTEGIPGMKVGGKRKLMIPSALAYGASGTPDGSIKGGEDLNFEVELVKVQ